eukprot:TRINITY_DN4913_c0_g1_i2.p1 TRINITY_DN4913_c0_g1~~TRINITY_DN4913_c0_g1_i2.p1  ORF type:complete len:284 (-),score=9.82 TRINITY_DN4913_c0_g1_i2:290-1141(-)
MIYGYQFLKVEEVCVQRGGSIGAQSITIDRDNCYYYTDKNSATIHRCCNNTEFEIYSGKTDEEGFQNGNVKQARYKHPTSIVYCGYDQYEGLYVADNKCIIRFINREDQVSTYLGSSDLSCGSQDNGTQIKLTQVSSLACDAGEGFLVIMNAGSAETFKVQVGTPPKPPSPATPGQIVKSPTKETDWVEQSGIIIWLPLLTCALGYFLKCLQDRYCQNYLYRRVESQQLKMSYLYNRKQPIRKIRMMQQIIHNWKNQIRWIRRKNYRVLKNMICSTICSWNKR